MSNNNIQEISQVGAIPSLPDDLKQIKHDLALLRNFIAENMQEGVDYGWLPFQDKKKDKASLFKPGAEKLTFYHQCAARFEPVKKIEDWEKPFFYYHFRCKLIHLPTGRVVGEGEGSCNSMSEKYRYRWVFENELPSNMLKEELKTKKVKGKDGKWYTMYRIEYEDVASLANTILKMALKSAHIDAALRTFRASWYFTQDIEDMGSQIIDAEYEQKPAQSEEKPSEKPCTKTQVTDFHKKLRKLANFNINPEKVKAKFKKACKVEHINELTYEQMSKALQKLDEEIEKLEEKENEIEEVPVREEDQGKNILTIKVGETEEK